jgi:hypothetical protein
VTNLSDVAKAPVKWKGGAWLGRNDLIEACKERGIQLPVSSSDVCSLSTKELKELLQPWHTGVKFHPDTKFDMFVMIHIHTYIHT